MKTVVKMERPFLGSVVRQRSDNGFFNANDLIKVGNKYRVEKLNLNPVDIHSYWYNNKGAKELITQVERKYGKWKITSKGSKGGTWVHPIIFIDIALWINPALKLEVYEWIYDELIKYRNESGDSYKRMSGALWDLYPNKAEFPKFMKKTALKIQKAVGVSDWQKASEDDLKFRNKIQENIALLAGVLRDKEQAVKLGIEKTLDNYFD